MNIMTRLFGGAANRSAGVEGQRGRSEYVPTIYPSSSPTSTISRYRDPSPRDMIVEQRRNRNILRAMSRTNPVIRSTLMSKVEIVVGDGPRPDCRHKDLIKLFMASAPYFDNRSTYDFGMWLGEDVAWNYFVDGDTIVRLRDRRGTRRGGRLNVPLQFQALTCDWMPDDHVGPSPWGPNAGFRNGVSILNDEVVGYAVYDEHPGDAGTDGRTARLLALPEREVLHLFKSSTGNPRGEVPLASVIEVAEDLDDLKAFERQRKKNSTAWATYLKKVASDFRETGGLRGTDKSARSTAEKQVRNMSVRPGDMIMLPEGYEPVMQQPTGEGADYQFSVRQEIVTICAIAGIPYFEALNDYDNKTPERTMRYAGAALRRKATRERKMIERQILQKLWIAFVNMAMATGMWTPPPGATVEEIYDVSWIWPVIQTAQLDRELNVMVAMVQAGVVPPRKIVEDYFGIDYEVMVRQFAEDSARASALGMKTFDATWKADTTIAKLILAAAEEEEQHERDLIQTAKLDTSIVPGSID